MDELADKLYYNAKNMVFMTKMNIWYKIDDSILSLEELLDINVTIIDREGVLHDEGGGPLFPMQRQSHRKIRICVFGFCQQCIQHCRYDMNAKAEESGSYFFSRCWKGVMEVVVPISANGMYFGLFFAGTWRDPQQKLPDNPDMLPESALKAYAQLPPFDYEKGRRLGEALTLFVQGIVASVNQMKSFDEFQPGRKMVIRHYLFKNASASATLQGLAAKLYLSPSRTSHLVKKLFGVSFQEMLINERINRARILLTSTDELIREIAEKVGINDEYYFSKIFKKRVGMSPGKFRKMNREKSLHS